MLTFVGPAKASAHHVPGHPERPARVEAVAAGVDALGLGEDLRREDTRPAAEDELSRVHRPDYLAFLRRTSDGGGGDLDPDTYVTAASWEAACHAAGAGLVAVERMRASGGVGLVAARPP
ncbi:MAG TPA: hypothetical protein VKW77_02780, partial [Acidimicrobiales bacterium]|nr:hypothetical protein [Acidimicrobiales bacterium]